MRAQPGIAGVVIELFADEIADGAPDGNTEMIATATSDETGAYALTGLPAGSYVALLPLSNWEEGGALYGCASSDPTTVDPAGRVEDDDNGVSLLDMGILAGPIDLETNDDSDSSIDFGCFDPLFDLALTTAPTSEEPLHVDDDLTVRIEVENQGSFSAGRVEVIVYLPEELELADEAWTVDLDGPIEPPEPPEPGDPGDDVPDSIEVPFPVVTFVPVPVFVPYPVPVFVPVPFRVEYPVHTDGDEDEASI